MTGVYTIEDVVLPIPGSRAIYPQHASADVYHTLARQDDVLLDGNACPHRTKDFSMANLPGDYR